MYLRLWAAFVTVMYSVDNSIYIYEYVYSVVYWYHNSGCYCRPALWADRFLVPLSLYDYFLSVASVQHVLHHSLCIVQICLIDTLIECFKLVYLQCLYCVY